MEKYFILFLSLAAVSFAYDFKDSDFNMYLLKNVGNEILPIDFSSRIKRDANPDQTGEHCCKDEKVNLLQIQGIIKFKQECYKELNGDNDSGELIYDPFDCEGMQNLKENMICISECIGKKFNALTKDNELDREKVLDHFNERFAGEPWKFEKTEKMVDKCLAEINNNNQSQNGKCSKKPLEIIHCMWKELIRNCPKDMQINSVKCNELRDKVEQNDEKYLSVFKNYKFRQMFQRN